MKKFVSAVRSKVSLAKVAVVTAVATASASASAELPTWATGIGTEVTGHITDALAMVGPIIALSVGAIVLIKVIKRLVSKV